MAKKNAYKQLLKELGFSEYMLSQFRKQQKEFEEYERKARGINTAVMKNGTTTRSFDYSTLYRTVKATGLVGRSALEEIREEQQRQIDALNNYGLTDEIIEVIKESVRLFNTYSETDISEDLAIKHIASTYVDAEDLSDVIDLLNEFADFCYKYEDSLNDGVMQSTGEYIFSQAYQVLVG